MFTESLASLLLKHQIQSNPIQLIFPILPWIHSKSLTFAIHPFLLYNIVKSYRKTLNAFGLSNQINVDFNETLSKCRAKILSRFDWINPKRSLFICDGFSNIHSMNCGQFGLIEIQLFPTLETAVRSKSRYLSFDLMALISCMSLQFC